MELSFKIGLFSLLLCYAEEVHAVDFVADVTSHLVAITSSFTGTSTALFGSMSGPGDIVAVVRGPSRDIIMRRQGRLAGLWITTESLRFLDIPSFYLVASSRPIEEILAPEEAKKFEIGTGNLVFNAEPPEDPATVADFREALVHAQRREGRFSVGARINILGENLFRTTIEFPANAPTGTYRVEVFLIQDKKVIGSQTTPLVVSKVGFVADLYGFAVRRPEIYAIACAVAASLTGLALRAIFTLPID